MLCVKTAMSHVFSTADHMILGAQWLNEAGRESSLRDHYVMTVVARERVAGREAWSLDITPKDEFRYGYFMSLDAETGLPLKLSLKTANNEVMLERLNFVHLETGVEFQREDFELSHSKHLQTDLSDCVSKVGRMVVGKSPLRPTWVPPGFVLLITLRKTVNISSTIPTV